MQVGIRDHWSKEDAPPPDHSSRACAELLGHQVVIEPEWQLLLTELGDSYADKASFVSIVAGCVRVWAKSMLELLDDPAQEDWTEELLEKTKRRSQLRAFLEVSSQSGSYAPPCSCMHGLLDPPELVHG